MIPIIYYAHSMLTYNTEREEEELQRLQEYFSNGLIYNPNRAYVQNSKTPMQTCLELVKDPWVAGIAFSHNDKKISSGVYAEIRLAQKRRKPIYIIESKRIRSYKGTIRLTKKDKATNWAEV